VSSCRESDRADVTTANLHRKPIRTKLVAAAALADMTTWDRDLYQGQVLPSRQQRQLESLVSQALGKPIRRTTLTDPGGYGLGLEQQTSRQTPPGRSPRTMAATRETGDASHARPVTAPKPRNHALDTAPPLQG